MNRCIHAALLVLMLGTLSACGGSKSAEELIAEAKVSIEQGDVRAAVIQLKNAIEQEPKRADARLMLGNLAFESGEMASAEKELALAMRHGADAAEALPAYAQALLALGLHEDLMGLHTRQLKDDALAVVLAAQGVSQLNRGDMEDAEKLIGRADRKAPQVDFVALSVAQLSFAKRDMKTAVERLKGVVQNNPDYFAAWLTLGEIYSVTRNNTEAKDAYDKALVLNPKSMLALYKRALLKINQDPGALIDEDVAAMTKLAPKHPSTLFLTGVNQFNARNLQDAQATFEQVSGFGDGYPHAYFYLAALRLREGSLEIAENNINRFLSLLPSHPSGLRLSAQIDMQRGDYAAAEETLVALIQKYPNDLVTNKQLATALGAQGKVRGAIDTLWKVTKAAPTDSEAWTKLGEVYFKAGRDSEGIEAVERALKEDGDYLQANVVLIRHYVESESFEKALEFTDGYQQRKPGLADPFFQRGKVLHKMGKTEEARDNWRKALELEPGNALIVGTLSDSYIVQKDFVRAREVNEQILASNKAHLPALLNLASIAAIQNDEEEMISRLREAIVQHPNAVQPKVILARHLMVINDLQGAEALLADLREAQRDLPSVKIIAASIDLEKRNFSSALGQINDLMSTDGQDTRYKLMMSRAYAGLGQSDKAIDQLQKVIAINPGHYTARVVLGRMYLAEKKNKLFRENLAFLQEHYPGKADVVRLAAAEAALDDNRGEAARLLEQAFADDPSASAVVDLAIQKRASGDVEGSLSLLESWIKDHPKDLLANITLAEFYLKSGFEEQALSQYKAVLQLDENNLSALNNTAWYTRKKNPDHALELVQRAISIAPGRANVLDTWAVILMEQGEIEKARRKIDEALDKAGSHPTVRYHDAQITAKEGDVALAKRKLSRLLEDVKSFAEREEAQKLLMSLGG